MYKRWQFVAVLIPLLLVELSAYWKLVSWLGWTTEGLLAFTTGLAFISLLMGGIVALGQERLPDSMRSRVLLAGVVLFLVQGLANVLISYKYGISYLPLDIPMRFFGIGEEAALKSTAIISGATLSIVSIAFWQVIGEMLRQQQQERQRAKRVLEDLDSILKEGLA